MITSITYDGQEKGQKQQRQKPGHTSSSPSFHWWRLPRTFWLYSHRSASTTAGGGAVASQQRLRLRKKRSSNAYERYYASESSSSSSSSCCSFGSEQIQNLECQTSTSENCYLCCFSCEKCICGQCSVGYANDIDPSANSKLELSKRLCSACKLKKLRLLSDEEDKHKQEKRAAKLKRPHRQFNKLFLFNFFKSRSLFKNSTSNSNSATCSSSSETSSHFLFKYNILTTLTFITLLLQFSMLTTVTMAHSLNTTTSSSSTNNSGNIAADIIPGTASISKNGNKKNIDILSNIWLSDNDISSVFIDNNSINDHTRNHNIKHFNKNNDRADDSEGGFVSSDSIISPASSSSAIPRLQICPCDMLDSSKTEYEENLKMEKDHDFGRLKGVSSLQRQQQIMLIDDEDNPKNTNKQFLNNETIKVSLLLPQSHSPCLHRGQPLFEWDLSGCVVRNFERFHSTAISFDVESGLVFVEQGRVCFYSKPWLINYSLYCKSDKNFATTGRGSIHRGSILVWHSRFSTTMTNTNGWVSSSISNSHKSGVVESKRRSRGSDGSNQQVLTLAPSSKDRLRRHRRWLRRRNPVSGGGSSLITFQQDRYVVEMAENATVGTLICTVHAIHFHRDRTLFFSMAAPQDSRSANLFVIDTQTGSIRLAKSLDREVLDKHVLKVTAYERFEPTVSTSALVIVDVLDVQDNAPIFERNSYFAEVKEDAPIGTTVASVFARDLDAGRNGEVRYSLSDDALGANLLKINPRSGVIQTAAELDREMLDLIRVSVIATDQGSPPMSSSALVEVTILDVNDNKPIFEMDSYNVTIMEDIGIPTKIIQLKAVDADAGENGRVHYSIVAASASGFTIGYDDGSVWVRDSQLDARSSPVSLVIRAKDSAQPAQSSTATLTVDIVDVNDHAPRFVASQQQLFIDENIPIGYEVSRVFAVDEDSGFNGLVRYSLVEEEGADEDKWMSNNMKKEKLSKSQDGQVTMSDSNETATVPEVGSEQENLSESNFFEVDRVSGSIRTKAELDREQREVHTLKIRAEDGGSPPKWDTVELRIHLRDVNDNAPFFEHDIYNVTVAENTPRGTQLITVKAFDADKDQKISYRIERTDRDLFTLVDLGEQGALLSLSETFLSSDEMLRVGIVALDQGGLKGRCSIMINVQDVNAAPIFLNHPFTIRIPEHSPRGFELIQLKAEDHDRRENAHIKYTIDSVEFAIDESNGLLTVAAGLDRELRSAYMLNITAQDNGSPPLSAWTTIEVVLEDVNDNIPQFLSNNYTIAISEDTPVGTSFMQILAVDKDSGANAIVDYFIDANDPRGLGIDSFKLDRSSGTLRVDKKLDREQCERHVIAVIARDRGSPPLWSSSVVNIQLLDVNDNAPQFELQTYNLWIVENAPIGTVIGTLIARDADDGKNALIEFKIFGGADAKLFDIEKDPQQEGVVHILSRATFDYEAKNNKFYLEIQASSGQLSSIVPVFVHVSDVNDNKPQLRDFVVLVANYEQENNNDDNIAQRHHQTKFEPQIGVMPAFDPDHNATLQYYIETNDVLRVERTTGMLSMVNVWQRHIDAHYKACVSDGPNTVCARSRIIYVPVDEETLREAVTVQILGINEDEFLDFETFDRFTSAISLLDHRWHPSHIRVIAVSSERGAVRKYSSTEWQNTAGDSDNIVSIHNDKQKTNVTFFVSRSKHGESSVVERSARIQELIRNAGEHLNEISGMQITTIADESCAHEPCSDSLKQLCNERIDQCYSSPCQHGATCIPLESRYRCVCTPDRTGVNCEATLFSDTCLPNSCYSNSRCEIDERRRVRCVDCKWAAHDTDDACRLRSLKFVGDGYLAIPTQNAIPRMEFKIEFSVRVQVIKRKQQKSFCFSIATILSSDSVLMFLGDIKADFLEVFIENALIGARLSLGNGVSEMRMEDWQQNRINDGEWHKITIDFYENKLILSLDDCETFVSLRLSNATGYRKCACELITALPQKCSDGAVTCHRFLDVLPIVYMGARPTTNGDNLASSFIGDLAVSSFDNDGIKSKLSNRTISSNNPASSSKQLHRALYSSHQNAFTGCIANLSLDGHLRDFSDYAEWIKVGKAVEAADSAKYLMLDDEESYVSWRIARNEVFQNVTFEFRTRQRDTQVIAIEFALRSQFIVFSISQGYGVLKFGERQFLFKYPYLADGKFKAISISLQQNGVFSLSIDHLFKKHFPLITISTDNSYRRIRKMYSGLAPSMSYPKRFEGCLRNVLLNGLRTKIIEQLRVESHCQVRNECDQANICPRNSRCNRDWDRHRCDCLKGYIGDSCMDICLLRGICSNNGQCLRVSNTTNGYECRCAEGFTGHNCERKAALKKCPPGWYGHFPRCRLCDCDTRKGFIKQCDPNNGACLCETGKYYWLDHCRPCECGFGALSTACSTLGQCECTGEAVGRRCDRCTDERQLLNRSTLKCSSIKNRCPSMIDSAIQWPTTVYGAIARQSCPFDESGMALRKCGMDGRWLPVDNYNCTHPSYAKVMNADLSLELVEQLANATSDHWTLRGVNVDIANRALHKLIISETVGNLSLHLKTEQFTTNLLKSLNNLAAVIGTSANPALDYLQTVVKATVRLGDHLRTVHQRAPFLGTFFYSGDNLVFAIDRLPRWSNDRRHHLDSIDSSATSMARRHHHTATAITALASDQFLLPVVRHKNLVEPVVFLASEPSPDRFLTDDNVNYDNNEANDRSSSGVAAELRLDRSPSKRTLKAWEHHHHHRHSPHRQRYEAQALRIAVQAEDANRRRLLSGMELRLLYTAPSELPLTEVDVRQQHKAITTIFYSVLTQANCAGCEYPIIMITMNENQDKMTTTASSNVVGAAKQPHLESIFMEQRRSENRYANHRRSIQVTVPILAENSGDGWRYPECVRLRDGFFSNTDDDDRLSSLADARKSPSAVNKLSGIESSSRTLSSSALNDLLSTDGISNDNTKWTTESATLIGLNETHAICRFDLTDSYNHKLFANSGGVFTLFMRADNGALIRFTLPHSIPYTAPLSAAFALLLILLAAVSTLWRPAPIRTRLIRFGFIVAFLLDASAIFFIYRIPSTTVFCPLRNALLSFCTCALFAWLFLYALRIYCLFVDGNTQPNFTMILLIGIIVPVMLSLFTFFFAPSCSLSVDEWLFWILTSPVMLLILTVMCLAYNAVGLFVLYDRGVNSMVEAGTNILLVILSAYIFLWSNYFTRESVNSALSGSNEMWLNDMMTTMQQQQPKTVNIAGLDIASSADPHSHSPLLGDPNPDQEDEDNEDSKTMNLYDVAANIKSLSPFRESPQAQVREHLQRLQQSSFTDYDSGSASSTLKHVNNSTTAIHRNNAHHYHQWMPDIIPSPPVTVAASPVTASVALHHHYHHLTNQQQQHLINANMINNTTNNPPFASQTIAATLSSSSYPKTKILSPATKVLLQYHHSDEDDDQTSGTGTCTPVIVGEIDERLLVEGELEQKNFYATYGRRSEDDSVEHAYDTYTSKKRKLTYQSSTFQRH
ncbi:unnamed protein product [Anisakis simplex]|uniref:Protocadherin-like wing polarity protein stan (inferred by orthology to a D. melanogaster protein) n=1 Tax=Anisakis simplex TaxID=6269 RepID=A0A158PN84_ANISI|nr:unnamed protein product [Anisakis simplex]